MSNTGELSAQGRNGDNDTDVQLSPGEIEDLLTAISAAFPTDAGAGRLLRGIGYPPDRIPTFTGFRDDAWYAVFNAFDNGIITAPYRKLLVVALQVYPAHPRLLQLAQRHGLTLSGDQPAPHEPAPSSGSIGTTAKLDQTTKDRLIDALMDVPGTDERAGRTALLSGIPSNVRAGLNRADNQFVDLRNIVDQLDSLGRLDNGERPIVILAHNASRTTRGTQVGRLLADIENEIEAAYGGDEP